MVSKSRFSKLRLWTILFFLSCIFYTIFAVSDGVIITPDSESYLSMSVSREPMYPLFLALFRALFFFLPGDGWQFAAIIAQGILTAFSGIWLVRTMSDEFKLSNFSDCLMAFIAILPALMCRFVARRHSMYSTNIRCEAIALPLFVIFFCFALQYVLHGDRKSLLLSALLSLVLISVRKQMYICIIILSAAIIFCAFRSKAGFKKTFSCFCLLLLVLVGNILLDICYNGIVQGSFVRHTGDNRFISTVLCYISSSEDAQYIEDPEVRELFLDICEITDREKNTYKYEDGSLLDRAAHFENNYDLIQFLAMGKVAKEHASGKYPTDSVEWHKELDKYYSTLNSSLFPVKYSKMLEVAFRNFVVGLMTTIASANKSLVAPVIFAYAMFLLLFAFNVKCKNLAAIELGLLSLTSILVNVGVVALTIFGQSRYTIYNMPIFFASFYVMFVCLIRKYKTFKF